MPSLAEKHLDLVPAVVRSLQRRLPSYLDADDLRGWGYLGLVLAEHRFQPERGTDFRHFASRTIRGAILDGLRREDWVSVSERRKAKLAGVQIPPPAPLEEADLPSPDPAERAESIADAALLFRSMHSRNPRLAHAAVLLAAGLRVTEAARVLGVSPARITQMKPQIGDCIAEHNRRP